MNQMTYEMMKSMVDILNKASEAYYSGNPMMSDSDFDARLADLQEFEKETGVIMSNSPSINVGAKVLTELKEIKHNHPMLSLEKCHSADDVIKFANNKPLVASIKLDGCFTGDTQILMSDGTYKDIVDVQVGDIVKSFNTRTKEICNKKVLKKFYNGKKEFDEWNRIYTNESRYVYNNSSSSRHMLNCTKNHKVLTENGWVESSSLCKNDEIYAYNYILSKSQEDFILGILLGDGWFVNRNTLCDNRKREIHYSKVNKDNYEIMIEKSKKLFNFNNPSISKRKSGYGSDMLDINLHSILLPNYLCNNNNVLRCGLTFTKEICNYLTPLSLAILYIDDGSKSPSREDGYENTSNQKVRCKIALNRHKKENVEIFSKWLNEHGYSNTIMFEKPVKNIELGDGYIINFTTDGTEKFFDDICKYIPVALRKRKLGLKEKWQSAKEINWDEQVGEYGITTYKVNNIKNGNRNKYGNNIRNRKSFCDAYDLEIEDTHTYFAEGICVHNCTTSLLYKDGKLIRAETRGNGTVGNDVTEHIKRFKNVPLVIDKKEEYIIDGEALITDEDFEELNKNGEFKNSRNLAAGTLSVLDTSLVSKRKLSFFAWDVIEGGNNDTLFDNLKEAEGFGFDIVPYWYVSVLNKKNLQNTIDHVLDSAKDDYRIPCDGVVFKFNNIEYGKSLGKTEHHFRNGIAYKPEDESKKTTLLDIDWTMGKTGILTPTAVFEAVELDGTTVERASVHNVSILTQLDLHIGDTVEVVKANKIIPQIKRNVSANKREALGVEPDYIKIPSTCPICGGATEIKQDNNSKVLVCTDDNCKGKLLGKLSHFVSKNAMNIDGLSEKTLEKLIDIGLIDSFKSIYELKNYRYELLDRLDGFAEKSVDNLLGSIESSKIVTFDRFLYALSIPLIGKSASKTIAKYCEYDVNNFLNIYTQNIDLTILNDFGYNMNDSVKKYIHDNSGEVTELCEYISFVKPNNSVENGKLNGKTFVITGKVNHFLNRDELKNKIESLGGKTVNSVNAKVDYLINNDINSTSSKNKKAKELGVKIITEDGFLKMIN